jgi:hypothetical protein
VNVGGVRRERIFDRAKDSAVGSLVKDDLASFDGSAYGGLVADIADNELRSRIDIFTEPGGQVVQHPHMVISSNQGVDDV